MDLPTCPFTFSFEESVENSNIAENHEEIRQILQVSVNFSIFMMDSNNDEYIVQSSIEGFF